MKDLNDVRNYAKNHGMSERAIERTIDTVVSDGNGNVTDEEYENVCFGIDCETDGI